MENQDGLDVLIFNKKIKVIEFIFNNFFIMIYIMFIVFCFNK